METINLKTALTFRVLIHEKPCAFATKTFRGRNVSRKSRPQPKDHVAYEVHEICLDSSVPWYTLEAPIQVDVIWSNVLSVQHEKEA